MPSIPTAVFGGTGLVGTQILSVLLSLDAFSPIYAIGRRAPAPTGEKLNAIADADSSTWASKLAGLVQGGDSTASAPPVVFSALGTTRAQAGSYEAQWKIDHDLPIELAKAARAAGTQTFVVISSAGMRGLLSRHSPYAKMKIGVEDAIKEAGFPQAIILRPGLLMGERENPRMAESAIGTGITALSKVFGSGVRDSFGQDADVIARAAVRAVLLAQEGKAPDSFWVLEQKDIVHLGREGLEGVEKPKPKPEPAPAPEPEPEPQEQSAKE